MARALYVGGWPLGLLGLVKLIGYGELSEPLVGVTVPAGVLLILGGRLGSRNTPPDRRRQLSVGDRIRPLGAVFAGLIWIAMGWWVLPRCSVSTIRCGREHGVWPAWTSGGEPYLSGRLVASAR